MKQMTAEALTDLAIRGLKPDPLSRFEVFDSKVPGFGVRVFPSGIKSFILLYRHNGRPRRLTIGRYPVLSLAEARRMANAALGELAHGADPQKLKAEVPTRNDVAATVDRFVETHCSRHNRRRTADETARILRVHVVKPWGRRSLPEISRGDIIGVLDAMVSSGKPIAANRTLAAIRKLFNWCVDRGLIEASPCAGLRAPAATSSRDRVLSDRELASIWKAAQQIGYPICAIVQLLILTAQRRGEVTDMRWSEVDLKAGIWTIPANRTKSNRQQVLPLPPLAIEIIAAVPNFGQSRVFPAQGGSDASFSGFGGAKRRLDDASGVSGWTFHDLRRTAATGMARLGVAPHVVERVLNHTSGSLGGVAGIYNRFGYQPEMRAALLRWADRISEGAERNLREHRSE